jgi:hypothetical protein
MKLEPSYLAEGTVGPRVIGIAQSVHLEPKLA